MADDPLAIVEPVEDDDPLKIVAPLEMPEEDAPNLQIAETYADDSVDNDNDQSAGSFFQRFFATPTGVNPDDVRSPTMADYLMDPEMARFMDAQVEHDYVMNNPRVRIARARSMQEMFEPIISGGQAIREGLTAPTPHSGGKPDARGVILSQALEAVGQVASGTIEMFTPAAYNAEREDIDLGFNFARAIREATRTPDEELAAESTPYKFTRALNQAAAFMLGGGAARKLVGAGTKMTAAVAAWLGAAVGGQMGAEDARAHGATPDQIELARYFNNAFGLSEGLPVGALFNRIDGATGGWFSRHVMDKIKSKGMQLTAGAFQGLLLEASQEAFQTFGENWTARDLAMYDPNRSLSDNIMEAAALGGSVGFLLSLLSTAAGIRNRGLREREIEEKILKPLNINSLDEIAGPFTLLSDRAEQLRNDPVYQEYQRLLDDNSEIDAKLLEETGNVIEQTRTELEGRKAPKGTEEQVTDELAARQLNELNPLKKTQLNTVENVAQAFSQSTKDSNVVRIAEVMGAPSTTEIPGKELPPDQLPSVSDVIFETDVKKQVVMALTRYQQNAFFANERNEQQIKELEAMDKTSPEFQNLGGEAALQDAYWRRNVMAETQKEVDALSRDIQTVIEKMIPLLESDAAIIAEDHSVVRENAAVYGQHHPFYAGPLQKLVHLIALDTKPYIQAINARNGLVNPPQQAVKPAGTSPVVDQQISEPIVVYHGFPASQLESVRENGILGTNKSTRGAVFVSSKPDVAFAYANDSTTEQFTVLPTEQRAVAVLEIPPTWYNQHMVQEYHGLAPEVGFDTTIPPEFIKDIIVGDRAAVRALPETDLEARTTVQYEKTNAKPAEKSSLDKANEVVRRERAGIMSTVVHEMAHAIAYSKLGAINAKIQNNTATEEERKLFVSVQNDYYRWLRDNLRASVPEATMAVQSLAGFARRYGGGKRFGLDLPSDLPSIGVTLGSADLSRFEKSMVETNTSAKTIEYLFSFQEFIAENMSKIAQENPSLIGKDSLPLFKDAIEDVETALKSAPRKFRNALPTMEMFWKSHSVQQQLNAIETIIGKEERVNPFKALQNDNLLTQEQKDRMTGEGDVFNRFMDLGFNILQIAEQNPHIAGLQSYVNNLRQWKNEVNNNLAIAEGRLNEWKELGKEDNEKLGRILYDETIGRLPDGGWLSDPRHFTDEEVASYGLSEDALRLREAIKQDFRRSLDQMEEVLGIAKHEIFKNDSQTLGRELLKLRRDFENMRKRPYFPLMRFGEYVMEIRSKGNQTFDGRDYKDGQIVEWQTFDTKRERDRALNQTLRTYVRDKISHSVGKRVMPNFSLQGMPISMLEHLESKLRSHELAPEVKEAIAQAKNDVLPFKSFRKQFQRRKRREGYSLDAMRSYANYMTSFSNHIGRVKYDSQFRKSFDQVEDSIDHIRRRDGGNFTKRASILNHMNEHLEYVMNPVNEFVGLRSAAFLWYLGFNVKSAAVNLTQVPLVTYPYLAARYGDGKAVAQLTRANKTAIKAIRNPDKLDVELRNMITKGMNENWLDESLATELALAASEKNLDKSLPSKWRQKAWLRANEYGSYLFHQAEKFNRHVTAIAAYRLARESGQSVERSQEAARHAVEKTQFEYARWARPKFMRGKLGGTVFVFQNYMQNALYFALGGDKGALRMIVMLFLIAGLQGLPFGEDIMDLVDASMTVLKKKTGMKDPHTQVRVDLREWLKEMDVDPDLVLHGLSSSTFGLAHLGEFMGWPIPDIDMSGSLSMGRIIPGTRMLPQMAGRDMTSEEVIGKAVTEAGGAILSAGGGIGYKLMSEHPDTWKAWEKSMPAFMRNISKAYRHRANEGEFSRSGYPINEYDHFDTKDVLENYAQMFGFPARDTTRGWEQYIAEQQAMVFYETWRQNVLRHWNFAKERNDEEATKEANDAIRAYNDQVPYPEMKIGPETRIKSYENYVRSRRMNERQIEENKIYRRLRDSVREVFEEGDN